MKGLVKWLLRRALYFRLAHFPLSEATALRWVEFMKRWPAIFAEVPFRRDVRLPAGFTVRVGLVDVIERNLLLHGCWDESIREAVELNLAPGATFVDVGANIGYFSLLASKLVGDAGTVLAIEPSHVNLSRLAEHLWKNASGNVLVASIAAGNGHALPTINFPTFNNAGAATLRPGHSVQGNRVMQAPLDEIFAAQGIRPDLVKLDVEGFELEALKGMRDSLARYAPVVICELTESFLRELGQSASELLAFMEALGYECETLCDPGRRPTSAAPNLAADQQDVIFRKRKDARG